MEILHFVKVNLCNYIVKYYHTKENGSISYKKKNIYI